MDTCKDQFGTPEACRELTVLSDAEINRCVQKAVVNERVEGECKSTIVSSTQIIKGIGVWVDLCLCYRPLSLTRMQPHPERT